MTHYDELGLVPSAGPGDVRRAYVTLARRHHPDAGGDPARMRSLNAAFAVLSDPDRRRRYDRDLGLVRSPDGPPAGATRPDRPSWSTGPDGPAAPADDLSGADPTDLADDTPFGPPVAGPSIAALPPVLFALALMSAALFFVFGHPALLAGAGALVFFAALTTAAVALLTLTRGARTTRLP